MLRAARTNASCTTSSASAPTIAYADPERDDAVALHQLAERLDVAGLRAADQLGVGSNHPGCSVYPTDADPGSRPSRAGTGSGACGVPFPWCGLRVDAESSMSRIPRCRCGPARSATASSCREHRPHATASITAEILRRADGIARRTGVSRRSLPAVGRAAWRSPSGCSTPVPAAGANGPGGTTTTTRAGASSVPDPEDGPACAAALGGTGELIVDVHTHHVMPDGPWRQAAPEMEEMIQRLVPDSCTAADPLECLDRRALHPRPVPRE